MKFSEIIEPLMRGKPVTRASWEHEVYVRYSELYDAFVMHGDGDPKTIQGITLYPEWMFADDWMAGEFHPYKDEIFWTQTKS